MTSSTYSVRNNLPKSLKPLEELAYNLWYAWHKKVSKLFDDLDHELFFKCGQSPIVLLKTISQEKLLKASLNHEYLEQLQIIHQDFLNYLNYQYTWFKKNHGSPKKKTIAYFCLEYGIHSSLPIYSGGLGILAGDHLKSASDLDLPLVAVGLLYTVGYFKQRLDENGDQQEVYVTYDPQDLPIEPIINSDGEETILNIKIGEEKVYFKVWRANIGRISLYLLDTNIPQNTDSVKEITRNLYVGDRKKRMQQEILIGIGGVLALSEMGIEPEVFHMNEGHSAFLVLERISILMIKHKFTWSQAFAFVKATSVFTTHTPVPAGNEYFDPWLTYDLLKDKVEELGVPWECFINLGRFEADNHDENFCMTILALRASAYANGVAKLHGVVSREMWKPLYPGLHDAGIPIGHITNGVHGKTWVANELNKLLHSYNTSPALYDSIICTPWNNIDKVPAKALWETHCALKHFLVQYIRAKYIVQVQNRRKNTNEKIRTDDLLNPDFLTIGFARRFATYKRGDLILKNIDRLKKLLNYTNRPIQIIFAGKAHPADQHGKTIIHNIFQFAKEFDTRCKMFFIEDYDIHIAKYLVQGVDVWLNNPVRPQEASGTSGMKAGMNGVLNLSVLDGWWDEAYSSDIGWEIGEGKEYPNRGEADFVESNDIYDRLENEIIPLFYERNAEGVPEKWVQMMKASIKKVGSVYNTHRMVSDYYNMYYRPAQISFEKLSPSLKDGYEI